MNNEPEVIGESRVLRQVAFAHPSLKRVFESSSFKGRFYGSKNFYFEGVRNQKRTVKFHTPIGFTLKGVVLTNTSHSCWHVDIPSLPTQLLGHPAYRLLEPVRYLRKSLLELTVELFREQGDVSISYLLLLGETQIFEAGYGYR